MLIISKNTNIRFGSRSREQITSRASGAGWASLLIAIVFFGGVQLFTIGIIGEYIGRIYDEIKNRPLYITKKEINFKE
jgi:dolichol-phosphate mannosyltransferase